jgi:hypothetical protein
MLLLSTITSTIAVSPAYGFKSGFPPLGDPPIHQDITREGLGFLRSDLIYLLKNAHRDVDENFGDQINPSFHFDDCEFRGSTQNINNIYNYLMQVLDPNNPASSTEELYSFGQSFGAILHIVQDFYSHSNWVELGKRSELVEGGFVLWKVLQPFTEHKGIIIVQGETIPKNTILVLYNDKTVDVIKKSSDPWWLPLPLRKTISISKGLITGSTYATDDCPDGAALGHWDPYPPGIGAWPPDASPSGAGFGRGLNKDYSPRPGFDDARRLAVMQTEHEWCRLANLVHLNHGREGLKALFDRWVADRNRAISACPTLDLPTLLNRPPVADSGGPYRGISGSPVLFDGSRSNDPDGAILVIEWDFGDGSTGTGIRPVHTYNQAGTFTVTLTVRDNYGFSGISKTTATIQRQAPTDFTVRCQQDTIPIDPGGESRQTICTVVSLNGFAQPVDLSCQSPTNPGITCSFSPSQVTPPANGSIDSTLTVSADFGALIGTHYLTIIGTSGGRTFTTIIGLDVRAV